MRRLIIFERRRLFNNLRSNSCDADDFCEVKLLNASENIVTNKKVITNILETTSISLPYINIINMGIFGVDNRDIMIAPGNKLIINAKNVTSSSLRGTNNAYACIDSQGNFFRSDTACR